MRQRERKKELSDEQRRYSRRSPVAYWVTTVTAYDETAAVASQLIATVERLGLFLQPTHSQFYL